MLSFKYVSKQYTDSWKIIGLKLGSKLVAQHSTLDALRDRTVYLEEYSPGFILYEKSTLLQSHTHPISSGSSDPYSTRQYMVILSWSIISMFSTKRMTFQGCKGHIQESSNKTSSGKDYQKIIHWIQYINPGSSVGCYLIQSHPTVTIMQFSSHPFGGSGGSGWQNVWTSPGGSACKWLPVSGEGHNTCLLPPPLPFRKETCWHFFNLSTLQFVPIQNS